MTPEEDYKEILQLKDDIDTIRLIIKKKDEEIDELEDKVDDLERALTSANDEIFELENKPDENPFYDSDKETLEDQTKSDLLKDNWEYFTAQQLEGFLKMIGRNI